jgi:predicted acylesterase/phospholipase RssA
LYVRGGGQHGTVGWGAVSAVLRHSTSNPFEHFAGDSFGSAIAVISALDNTGETLFFDRVVETCHRMQLDERNRPLDRDAAIEFVCESLHEHIDRTLSDLNLPVDILVTNLARGVEHAVLNRHTAPDMKLKDALVASMSLPFVIGEHFSYFDGGLTAWDYVDRLGDNSIVVGLATSNMSMEALSVLGSSGTAVSSLLKMWQKLTGQYDVLHSYKPYEQFCVPTRDFNVSILGGMIGTTSWHILNFQHGFEIVSSAI